MSLLRSRQILVLKHDVKNPKPDRRNKNCVWAEPVWPKDSLWCHVTYRKEDELQNHLESLDMWGIGGCISRYGNVEQWNVLGQNGLDIHFLPYVFDSMEFSEREFNALQLLYHFDSQMLVKYLFASGAVDRQVLLAGQRAIDDMEDSADVWKANVGR